MKSNAAAKVISIRLSPEMLDDVAAAAAHANKANADSGYYRQAVTRTAIIETAIREHLACLALAGKARPPKASAKRKKKARARAK